jgi:zinc protease
MRLLPLAVAAAVALFPTFVGATPPEAPSGELKLPIETMTLPNGLRVILHEDHRTQAVTVNVWYKVGFSDDPPEKRGLAHLFEHLMLRGSKHVGRDKFLSTLNGVGATDVNATTSLDRTSYFETVPANQIALALWLESDRMGYFLDMIDASVLEKEKEVVRSEYRKGMLDRPYSFVSRFGRNAVFPTGHPYHWKIDGEMADTDGITTDDLRGFFRTYYAPSNASLCIAGDFDVATAKALVTKYFATLPSAARLDAPRRDGPVIASEVHIDVEAGVPTPRLEIGWAGPPKDSEEDAALSLASDVLARSKAGRLHEALVTREAIADNVDVWPDYMGERHGMVRWVTVDLKKGASPARALEVVDRVLEELQAKGPTPTELAGAKARSENNLLWSLEPTRRRAELLNELAWFNGDPAAISSMQRWRTTATADTLRDAARRWLPKEHRSVVFVVPTEGAPVGGREVKR